MSWAAVLEETIGFFTVVDRNIYQVPDEFASAEEIDAPLSDDGTFHHGNGDEDYDAELDDLEKEFN